MVAKDTSYVINTRDYFAAHAPLPDDNVISNEMLRDMSRIIEKEIKEKRTRFEIIADLAYEYADAMMRARDRGGK